MNKNLNIYGRHIQNFPTQRSIDKIFKNEFISGKPSEAGISKKSESQIVIC